MLGDVQCKSSRSVSRTRAAGFAFVCVVSIALVCATLATPPIAYAYSGGESSAPWYKRVSAKPQREIVGRASWYGPAVAGHKTATGERLDPNQLTAATTQLPLQSNALVTNLNNGRSVPVRINDCGPYAKGRDIDVSKRAAQKLAMARSGTVPVTIKLLAAPPDAAYCPRLRPAHRRVHTHRRHRRF
jgi:rare lipoprotein A